MNKQLKPKPVRAIASQEFPPVTGVGAITQEQAIAMAKEKGKSEVVIATASESTQEPKPETDKPNVITITPELLNQTVQNAIASALTTKSEEFAKKEQEIQAELERTKLELTAAKTQVDGITQVLTTLGHTHPVSDKSSSLGFPAVNKLFESGSDRLEGRIKDFVDLIESASSAVYTNRITGERYIQRDMRSAESYFVVNRATLRAEMERFAKKNGCLKGITDKAAATVRTDILPTLLDYASMVMRTTHSGTYVFWQLVFNDLELGKGPGDTIQVPRARDLAVPTSVTDTLIADSGPGATRSNLAINSVSLTLQRRGLNQPVAIPEFLTSWSIFNLENIVAAKLGKHYQADSDLRIRARYFATTRVVYNDAGSVTSVPANVGAGDDGTATESFLNSLYAYLTGSLNIDTDETGSLIFVGNPLSLAPLKNSLTANNRFMEVMSMEKLTAIFTQMTNADMPTISGYVGTFCGFHIFQSTAYGGGSPPSEGVQIEVLGTGSQTTRTCFAAGFMAVARAVGMSPEIRRANEDNFQTVNAWTWISDEIVGDLDVDSAINGEQQIRVVEVHVTDIPQ